MFGLPIQSEACQVIKLYVQKHLQSYFYNTSTLQLLYYKNKIEESKSDQKITFGVVDNSFHGQKVNNLHGTRVKRLFFKSDEES